MAVWTFGRNARGVSPLRTVQTKCEMRQIEKAPVLRQTMLLKSYSSWRKSCCVPILDYSHGKDTPTVNTWRFCRGVLVSTELRLYISCTRLTVLLCKTLTACIPSKKIRSISISEKKVSENKTVRNFKRWKYLQHSIRILSSSRAHTVVSFMKRILAETLLDTRNALIEFVLLSRQCIRKTLRTQ